MTEVRVTVIGWKGSGVRNREVGMDVRGEGARVPSGYKVRGAGLWLRFYYIQIFLLIF